jgi:hypothetical protein
MKAEVRKQALLKNSKIRLRKENKVHRNSSGTKTHPE